MLTTSLILFILYLLFSWVASWIRYFNKLDKRFGESIWRYSYDHHVVDETNKSDKELLRRLHVKKDDNRKKTSAFHNLMGQKVASEGVTIVDDGTLNLRRGSLTIDDEGTPTENTVLIENGILKNFMQDRLNARLMNTKSTGSGRRESYKHVVLPRMRNTMMLSGKYSQDEMIKSVDKGIFAVSFGGGQVDITSGKFVFNCTEAYEINNGKIGSPIKGATLIGDGPSILKEVSMVGNDMKLDPGIGTCGKAGQGVPVGVAQPSILINKMTVGGTQL